MLKMNCMLQVNWRRIGVLLPGVRQVGLDCPDKLVPPGVLPGVRQVGPDCPDKLVPPRVMPPRVLQLMGPSLMVSHLM